MFKKILEKVIVFLVLIGMLITSIPISTKAGVNQDKAIDEKAFILDLVGSDDSPEYRSGQALSNAMNAKQIEDGLWELLDKEVEPTISDLEEAVTYANNKPDEDYDKAFEMLYALRQIRMAVKGCYEIIVEDRSDIKITYDTLENPEKLSEHEIELLSVDLLEKAEELKEEIANAVEGYSSWLEQLDAAQERLINATPDTSLESSINDVLQAQLVSLKTGRAAELKELEDKEKSNTKEKDIVLDVISINEIRIYAWDQDKKPLKDATIYCWAADPTKTDENKGEALKPNNEGYVTIPISKLGADADHYMTIGFEVSCPGYRTQYAHADFILGGEGIICKLEKNNPNEDIYIAGISLNGYDTKWYQKNMYITEENDADQTVTLYLRSQSGKDVNGTAKMTYKKSNDKNTELTANYEKTKKGEGQATFKAKLCQEIDPKQKDAITFNLSTSNSNAEEKPNLKIEPARFKKTQFNPDQTILSNIGLGNVTLSGPSNIPILQALTVSIDFEKMFGYKQPIHFYSDCSGLWAVVGATGDINVADIFKKLWKDPNAWKTEDTKKLERLAKGKFKDAGLFAKDLAEQQVKKDRAASGDWAWFGEAKFYVRAMLGAMGDIARKDKEANFVIFLSFTVGFRGDWKASTPPAPFFPIIFTFGFDLSLNTFFKFQFVDRRVDGLKWDSFNLNIRPQFNGYVSVGVGLKHFLEIGARVALTLTMTFPIIHHKDEAKQPIMFNASVGLSFYFTLFFININYNLVSGKGYRNLTTGAHDWKTVPFWKKDNLNADDDQLADNDEGYSSNETPDEKIYSQEEISGDTLWTYNGYTYSQQTDAVPIYFNLHWESKASSRYTSDTNYICWVEGGKTVKYRTANYGEGDGTEFVMPDEVKKHLDSGEWKITGVRAAVNPEVYSFTDHAAGQDVTEEFQVATMTVTIGTKWQTITETVDGKELTREAPMGSVVVTRMFLSKGDGIMQQLNYIERKDIRKRNPDRHPVIFVEEINAPVTDAIGLVSNIQLANITREPWAANFDIVMINNKKRKLKTYGTIPSYYNGNATLTNAETDLDDEEETTELESTTEETTTELETTTEEETSTQLETTTEEETSTQLETTTEEESTSALKATTEETTAELESTTDEETTEETTEDEQLTELEESSNAEGEAPTSGPGLVLLQGVPMGESIKNRGYSYLNMPNGTPIKQLIGSGGTRPFVLVLMDNGGLYAYNPLSGVADITGNKRLTNISSIGNVEILCVDRKKNDEKTYVVFVTPKENENESANSKTPLYSFILKNRRGFSVGKVTDYDIDLKGSAFFTGHLLNENYLYWFDEYEDKNKNHITAVRGMCYSPKHNMLLAPSRLGVLTGTDGNAPQGFVTTSSPLYSQVLSDGNMIITKAWIPDSEQGESRPQKILSTFRVEAPRRVYAEIVGACPKDKPFVSAGRDNDMAISFINKGNIPIVGFDLKFYYTENGQKTLMQTNHIDILNPKKNKVTYPSAGYTNGGNELFEGNYASRRIDGLFDMINKDAWNIKRYDNPNSNSENGNVLVKVPAMMPEGSQTYSTVFRVPINWSGKKKISCEIDKVFVPEHVADIFDSGTQNGVQSNIDFSINPSEVKVLAISATDENEGILLAEGEGLPANVSYAGTLADFSDPGDEAESINGADYTFAPSVCEIECENINLALSCRVFEDGDEEYATITVRQEGQTEAAPQGLKIQSWLDEQEYPSFEYTFATHPTGGQEAYSITVPLSRLTNNQDGDILRLTVSDTVDSNIEGSSVDNYTLIELNTGLRIVSQPQDVSVKQGQNATLSVEAAGGQEPYKYTWQKFENNKWVNVQSGSNPELVVRMVTKEMNGKLFRCVVEDSADGRVESDTVKLTVTGVDPYKPDTSDPNNMMAWLILLILALAVGAAMIIIDKRRRI